MVRLFVKNNLSGDVHEYGDDSHDSLILSEDGSDPRLREDYIEYGVEPYINIGGENNE